MIFSCGENYAVRKARLENWHPFFPLFPRTVAVENGRDVCAWLQPIERKGTFYCGIGAAWWEWEYRLPEQK